MPVRTVQGYGTVRGSHEREAAAERNMSVYRYSKRKQSERSLTESVSFQSPVRSISESFRSCIQSHFGSTAGTQHLLGGKPRLQRHRANTTYRFGRESPD
uniref:(northern house mosquito) hypothetical protein n=1 Tax=Culex pipiens TaxID=7175 RepID=A0A8D8CCF6_CULPI